MVKLEFYRTPQILDKNEKFLRTFEKVLAESDIIVEPVSSTINSTTLYGALDPNDRKIYRVKVIEKIKKENVYSHYRYLFFFKKHKNVEFSRNSKI